MKRMGLWRGLLGIISSIFISYFGWFDILNLDLNLIHFLFVFAWRSFELILSFIYHRTTYRFFSYRYSVAVDNLL